MVKARFGLYGHIIPHTDIQIASMVMGSGDMLDMFTGRQHEIQANVTIAEWLNYMVTDWHAVAERTGTLQGSTGRPDIIVRQHDRMPVIVETEYGSPAVSDASSRLGEVLVGETRPFTEVIALGIQELCRQDSRELFRQRLDANERIFSVRLVSRRNDEIRVWPQDRSLLATPGGFAQKASSCLKSEESARIVVSCPNSARKLLGA